ncbi:uncharacterized protein N0V89_003857 [Didymosphaeria variabile]|uniref:Uncharacterized protein n=1 Tax=Didymosphaeria variabile TaxID=1932322 RepID=A0A9W8XQR2_9PLEO|nr:uncharacterized protein N0V89_003857 [Didymosphaeria variabile]KAJ4355836.1 hypothetical protein N0V89_003857 [Didymosphaeria variabile]
MRDHLKDVHDLSKDLLAKLNFKSGRFRSLKTIEEKWKHAFIILFPEVPKDDVPAPFETPKNTNKEALPAPVDDIESSLKDGGTNQVQLDITSLLARIQNRLFDRLNIYTNVPTSLKMDILANFETDFDDIVATLAEEAALGTANVWKSMAYGDATNPFEDLNLDWSCLATDGPTPDLEFADNQSTTLFNEPVLSADRADGEPCIDRHTVHGLPGFPLLVPHPMFESMYNDAKWNVSQPDLTDLLSSINDELHWTHMCQIAPSSTMSNSATDEKKVQDFGYQLPTPPVTPSSCSSPVCAKIVPESIPGDGSSIFISPTDHKRNIPLEEISMPIMTDDKEQDEFDISGFLHCLEDEQYYYLNSFELDQCYNRDM